MKLRNNIIFFDILRLTVNFFFITLMRNIYNLPLLDKVRLTNIPQKPQDSLITQSFRRLTLSLNEAKSPITQPYF